MKRLALKALSAGATFAGVSLAAAQTVAAQSYYYSSDLSSGAASGLVFGSILLYCCILCVPLIIWTVVSYLVYKDAVKNNVDNAALWGILVFFFSVVGILIYFLAIRPEAIKKNEGKGGSNA